MSWLGVWGHDRVAEQFGRAVARGRLASTFLFVGPPGVGKRTFANALAKALLCREAQAARTLDPCGQCASCVACDAGSHPDLEIVAKPKDKASIPIDLLIGADEKRGQTGLVRNLSLKPYLGGRKVAIIDDADDLGVECANALLKTLEEPPPSAVLILVGSNLEGQLPTIRSRSQIVRFDPLPIEVTAELLRTQGVAAGEADRLARLGEGSLTRAMALGTANLAAFRQRLLTALAESPLRAVSLSRETSAFIDESSKDNAQRRAKARQIVEFAADFYRHLARALVAAPNVANQELTALLEQRVASWPGDVEAALECAERCLETVDHLHRNVNLNTAIEAWLDDLVRLSSPRAPVH